MTEVVKCKRCGRDVAPNQSAWDNDETDGTLCGVGVIRDRSTAADDCRGHQLHVTRARLSKAESLLSSAAMTHLMSSEYQQKLSDDIRAFLQEHKP